MAYVVFMLNILDITARAGLRLWGARGHIFVGGPAGTTFFVGPFPIPIGLTNYNIIK